MREYKKELMTSIRAILCFTLLAGCLYPLGITLIAKLALSQKASGSLVTKNGVTVGSELIAQGFAGERYFWPRPSAVKFDAAASGASNLGPTSADLVKVVHDREAGGLVGEMRFSSGSGLDPHVGPDAVQSQIKRVGSARRLNTDQMKALALLVETQTEQRQFGFLGQPRINILRLNLLLDEHFGK